jgi:uncharacterized protein (DUF169 family)
MPMSETTAITEERIDWKEVSEKLQNLLRLRTLPIGMKLFETIEEMEAIPKIRRPKKQRHTTCQIVTQARQVGWTVGVTIDNLMPGNCGAVIGLIPVPPDTLDGSRMAGVWFKDQENAAAHQAAMFRVPPGKYKAMVVSPLASGRLDPPDIALIYGTPGQMILFINGLQWKGYKRYQFGVVGESACSDSWGQALATGGEPSLSIPCYAERRYGGVADDEMLMALRPQLLPKVVEGLEMLSKAGLRYPIPAYGIQMDPSEGLSFSYPEGGKR